MKLMDKFKTILERCEVTNHVKKSKFIGIVFPCSTIEEFDLQLLKIKKEHNGASHHCFAYRITDNILLERYQDDKEPSGTAGVPILDVLKGQELTECGVVVVRYFGGTKLGTGGLSRAYSDAARDALELAAIVSKEEANYITLEVDYHYSGKIEYYINSNVIPLIETSYNNNVVYTVAIPTEEVESFMTEIKELTSGQAQLVITKRVVGFFNKNQFMPN